MNERTHFFIKIYLSYFILERVDVSCVWEVTWRHWDRLLFQPKVLLIISALLSHPGWASQPWVTEGPSPPSGAGSHSAGILSLTDSNWVEPPRAPDYITVLLTPASAVLSLIYTGASLDWRLDRGSICYKDNY